MDHEHIAFAQEQIRNQIKNMKKVKDPILRHKRVKVFLPYLEALVKEGYIMKEDDQDMLEYIYLGIKKIRKPIEFRGGLKAMISYFRNA